LTALVYLSRFPRRRWCPLPSPASPDHQEHPYAEAPPEGPSSQISPQSVSAEAPPASPCAGAVSDHGPTPDPPAPAETERDSIRPATPCPRPRAVTRIAGRSLSLLTCYGRHGRSPSCDPQDHRHRVASMTGIIRPHTEGPEADAQNLHLRG
jgi:hypothetical protein